MPFVCCKHNIRVIKMENNSGVTSLLPILLFSLIPSFYLSAKTVSNDWSITSLPSVWIPKLDVKVSAWYISWFGLQCLLYVLPVGGGIVKGAPGNKGHCFTYRLNGFFVLAVNILLFFVAYLSGFKVSAIVDKTWELTSTAFLFPCVLSAIVMLMTRVSDVPEYNINPNANKGNIFQDWLLGKTINPRIGFLDLKLVAARSSVIALVLYQFSIVAKFYERYNTTNYGLLLAVGMQLLYIADGLWFEFTMVNFKEMSCDGCGALLLMLSVSLLLNCSVAANITAQYNIQLSSISLIGIALLFMFGYSMYRLSNDEKTRFRQNPDAPEFKDYGVISTKRGTDLLASGWWGMCRHPNYLGDIIMNIAISLPSGFSYVFAYFNPVVVVLMLMDRERNDSQDCKEKYGDDWDTYCHRVRYRLIPGVY